MAFPSGYLLLVTALLVGTSLSHPRIDPVKTVDKDPIKEGDPLIFLHTVWRHGSRAPLRIFKNDPNQEEAWPFGVGNLAPNGMIQCMNLGKRLRELYGDFVSNRYVNSEVYVRSSDTNRTLLSAISHMIGFYGKSAVKGVDYPDAPDWPDGYVPIPVHTVDHLMDDELLGISFENCDRFQKAWNQIVELPEYRKLVDQYQSSIKEGEKVTGEPIDMSLRDSVYYLVDEHFVDKLYDKPLTPGFTDQLYADLNELSEKATDYEYGLGLGPRNGVDYALEMALPMGGPLLWQIIERMQFKVKCLDGEANARSLMEKAECHWIDKLKYYAYSAHDNTISSLFATFGFPHTNWNRSGYPNYSSCVAFELRKSAKTRKFYLRVLYIVDGDELHDLTEEIRGCEQGGCTLEEFANRSEVYRIANTTEYCDSEPGVY